MKTLNFVYSSVAE